MLKLLKYFLWLVVLLALSVGFDRLMLTLPLHTSGLKQTQQFYVDFRTRLIGLFGAKPESPPDVIEAVIKKAVTPAATPAEKTGRYLYVDNDGVLQFADSLQQVPSKYRQAAQRMAE